MKKYGILSIVVIGLMALSSPSYANTLKIQLQRGAVADYGATPWYTQDLQMGVSLMNFTLDTGTTLFWATTTECQDVACQAHPRVDTKQSDYHPLTAKGYPKTVSFGPWGSMQVKLAKIGLHYDQSISPLFDVQFAASYQYSGSKFQYLSWGGGIGLPSETKLVDPVQTSFMRSLVKQSIIQKPIFSVFTDEKIGAGTMYIGEEAPQRIASSVVTLAPKKSKDPDSVYLWGTELQTASLGGTAFPKLQDTILFLDTGSSRFKAGSESIAPILAEFLKYTYQGKPIFTEIKDGNKRVGLQYANGKSPMDYKGILPNFMLKFGQMCKNQPNYALVAGLSPEQYSYEVDTGDRAGTWVLAFHILEGIEGLLVGSTLLDNMVTTFEHTKGTGDDLSQGNMYVYQKSTGGNLAVYDCQK